MIQIFYKEVSGFLNSLVAYIVIAGFLTSIGLLMWVFPDTSVFESGYAGMDTLFSLGPYVFLLLIPAITMRSFAEEKKLGTLELLQTKPVSDWDILFGKFLSAVALVFFALLPTLTYYLTIYMLGSPKGNIDSSGVAGSYAGLLFLGCAYCAIGITASVVTTNQVVAFILAAFGCFVFYTGIDSFSSLPFLSGQGLLIKQLGLLYHYESMSRGLIDSRDLLYFVSLCGAFLLTAKTILSARSW